MSSDTVSDIPVLVATKFRVPHHVVYRSFPSETVMLNLNTGRYHGLNAIAGSMLDALEKASCLREAAAAVAEAYGQSPAVVEEDMCDLCRALLDRGLIELDAPAG